MEIEALDSGEALAMRAAEHLAQQIRASVGARGRCLMAVSGGTEPWAAFRALATMRLPWHALAGPKLGHLARARHVAGGGRPLGRDGGQSFHFKTGHVGKASHAKEKQQADI